MTTTTPITTYTVPDPANGVGLLNVGPAGKTFLACRGTAGGLLPDEAPVVVDRAAMLLWMAWATPETLEEAMTDAELWAGQEATPVLTPEQERERDFRVQTCGRYVLESAYYHPERGHCVFDRATWDGWYVRDRRAAVSAVFYLNENEETPMR